MLPLHVVVRDLACNEYTGTNTLDRGETYGMPVMGAAIYFLLAFGFGVHRAVSDSLVVTDSFPTFGHRGRGSISTDQGYNHAPGKVVRALT